ncbi:MAG: right-handed parallel beta-helix repeat-containing protein [Planctomycetota bacterium]
MTLLLGCALEAQALEVHDTAPIGAPLTFRIDTGTPVTDYWIELSFGGTAPGYLLPTTNRLFPLNRPWVISELGGDLNPTTFANFTGTSDSDGYATATMFVREQPALVGLQMNACLLIQDPTAPEGVRTIIGPRSITITPADRPTWTQFPPSSDSRVVYVSSAWGSDSYSGLSPSQPVRSVAKGISLIRHGYPDQLLFRRGDVWDEPIGGWKKGGRSASEPLVIGSYGRESERPLFRTGTASGITFTGGGGAPPTMDHVALVGLSFYAHTRDPQSPSYVGPGASASRGLLYLRPGTNLLIEDCEFRCYAFNVVVQGEGAGLSNFKLRRNVIADSYGIVGSYLSQGIYMINVHGAVIEGNVFDRNGYDDQPGGTGNIYGHNIYVQFENSDITVRDNLIARGASHGIQLRCGGRVLNNAFVRNAISVLIGAGAPGAAPVANEVRGNVVLHGRDIGPNILRGWAVDVQSADNVTITENIFAHNSGSFPVGVHLEQVNTAVVEQNTMHMWNGGNLQQTAPLPSHDVDLNILSQGPSFANNLLSPGVEYRAASRGVDTFTSYLGSPGSIASFLDEAREQKRNYWRPAFTARSLQSYMREGFRPKNQLAQVQIGAVPYQ